MTINAAYSVDRAKTIGSFDVGKQADITIYDAPNLDYLFYFFATNLVTDVYKKGQKSFNLLHFIWDFARLQKISKVFLKPIPVGNGTTLVGN